MYLLQAELFCVVSLFWSLHRWRFHARRYGYQPTWDGLTRAWHTDKDARRLLTFYMCGGLILMNTVQMHHSLLGMALRWASSRLFV